MGYADEWDMLSDSEKLEMLGLWRWFQVFWTQSKRTNQPNILKHIPDKPLTAIYKDLNQQLTDNENQTKEQYEAIVNFLNDWSTYDDATKQSVVNYEEQYNQLSSTQKKEVDALSKDKTNQSFLDLIEDYTVQETTTNSSSTDYSSSQTYQDYTYDQNTQTDSYTQQEDPYANYNTDYNTYY